MLLSLPDAPHDDHGFGEVEDGQDLQGEIHSRLRDKHEEVPPLHAADDATDADRPAETHRPAALATTLPYTNADAAAAAETDPPREAPSQSQPRAAISGQGLHTPNTNRRSTPDDTNSPTDQDEVVRTFSVCGFLKIERESNCHLLYLFKQLYPPTRTVENLFFLKTSLPQFTISIAA